MAPMPYRAYPCAECPFRRDNAHNANAKFPAEAWEHLADSAPRSGDNDHPDMTDPLFGCHMGTPGHADDDLACAGWLALVGEHHVRIRLAIATGDLPAEALQAGDTWPPMHSTWDQVVTYQTSSETAEGPSCGRREHR